MNKVYAREVIESLRRKRALGGSPPDFEMYVIKVEEFVNYALRNMEAHPQDAQGALRDAQSFLRTLRSLVSRPEIKPTGR